MTDRQANFEQFARELAFPLDEEIRIGGNYRSAVQHGDLLFISGQIPRVGTVVAVTGQVGSEVTLAQARRGACICAMRALCILRWQLGSLDRVEQVLQMTVYTQCALDFTGQSEVADAASDLLQAVLGEAGAHARTSVGVCQLPKNASVELNMTVAVQPVA